jgi:hypothetical protein
MTRILPTLIKHLANAEFTLLVLDASRQRNAV